jgi:integrase
LQLDGTLRLSTRSLQIVGNCLERAIRHAEIRDLAGRNVAALVRAPRGRPGRLPKSLALEQAQALLAAAKGSRLYAYVALSVTTGLRTEELRALRWDEVDLDEALREHRKRQAADRLTAGALWQDHGLVFASAVGMALDRHNVRRAFRRISWLRAWGMSGCRGRCGIRSFRCSARTGRRWRT